MSLRGEFIRRGNDSSLVRHISSFATSDKKEIREQRLEIRGVFLLMKVFNNIRQLRAIIDLVVIH